MCFTTRPLTIIFLFLLCTLLSLGQAIAQDEDLTLDEIIVTAEKTKADAQGVSIPISVLSKTDIEDRGIDQFDDLHGLIPNLQFLSSARPGGGSFNFRGLGMFGMSVISEKSPVLINVDGIPWEGRFATMVNFDDVEQIEFLRGPQGTLYGKTAMGGVLNITTMEPDNQVQGKVGFTMEENNTYKFTARCQGPVVKDKLFYFISGSADTTDGWLTDHTPGGKQDWSREVSQHFLTKLVYKPTDRFTAAFQYSLDNNDGGNAPWIQGHDIVYDTTTGFTNPDFSTTSHNAALKMDYAFDKMTLTSSSTMRVTHTESNQYFGFPTSCGFDDMDEDVFTQEIRLASNADPGQFNWLAGLFYSREHIDRKSVGGSYNYSEMYGGTYSGFYTNDYPSVIDSDIYALFGQVSIPVFTEKLILTLGGRYEYTKREMDHRYELSDHLTGALYQSSSYSVDNNWDCLLGKASLSYQWTPNLMAYASVSQGYTPGGFNYIENDPEYAAFDEQKSLDYELGIKSMLWGNRLMINPNIFYSDYKDLQISEQVGNTMNFIVVNAGEAHATGIEMDWRARLSGSIELYGSFGIIQAEYDDYTEDAGYGAQDYSGNKMVNTPAYTFNVGAKYRNPIGFFASIDFQRFGETYFSCNNDREFKRDAFHLINGKIGWEFSFGLEAYVYVTNALDEEYYTEVTEEYGMYMTGQPRTLGMQLAYRF